MFRHTPPIPVKTDYLTTTSTPKLPVSSENDLSTVALGARPQSIFVDSKDLLPGVAIKNLSGTHCFES